MSELSNMFDDWRLDGVDVKEEADCHAGVVVEVNYVPKIGIFWELYGGDIFFVENCP